MMKNAIERRAWLAQQSGRADASVNDQWHIILERAGFHGALNEMQIAYWRSLGGQAVDWNELEHWFWAQALQGPAPHPHPQPPEPQARPPEPPHTPHIVPHATPLPEPIKIPPLAQKQQDAVDAMSKQELIAWMIEHLYFGNQVLRPYLESTDEAELRQQVRDAQEQPAPPPPLDADFG